MSASDSGKTGRSAKRAAAGWGYDSSPTSGIAYTAGGFRSASPTMRDYERTRKRMRRDGRHQEERDGDTSRSRLQDG